MPKKRRRIEFDLPSPEEQRRILDKLIGKEAVLVTDGPFRQRLVIRGKADGSIELEVREEPWEGEISRPEKRRQ